MKKEKNKKIKEKEKKRKKERPLNVDFPIPEGVSQVESPSRTPRIQRHGSE